MDWTAERQADAEFARGYQEQTAWLQGKTLDEARDALNTRLGTVSADAYNLGGDSATWDYINAIHRGVQS